MVRSSIRASRAWGFDVETLAAAFNRLPGYRFKLGHPAPSTTCHEVLTALPGHG